MCVCVCVKYVCVCEREYVCECVSVCKCEYVCLEATDNSILCRRNRMDFLF